MFGLTLKEKINKVAEQATDLEVIETIAPLLKDRVTTGVAFITNEDELVIGYKVYLVVGDVAVPAEPTMLEWPYQPMPVPEALKKGMH